MSRRYWLAVSAASGVALATLAYGEPIGNHATGEPGPAQHNSEPQSETKPSDLSSIKNSIRRIARALEPKENEKKSTKEDKRGARDLRAQEGMARWAMWMFWVALTQAILSVAGIIFIWKNLILTRQAVEASVRSAEASRDMIFTERAWMAHSDIIDATYTCPNIKDGLQITVWWENSGRSPAIAVNATSLLFMSRDGSEPKQFPPPIIKETGGVVGPRLRMSTAQCEMNDERYELFKKREARFFLYARVDYRDVYQPREPRHTALLVEMIYNGTITINGRPARDITFNPIGDQNHAA